ncbi:MAG: hypothetical protein ABJD11_10735 [Gemmatimonadota bacterium]
MIYLDTIAFNHDPTGATHDAINLRKNATQWIPVPEWRRGVSLKPEDSLAAYAAGQVGSNVVTIQVSLSSSDPGTHSTHVRAIDGVIYPPPPSGCGCLGWLLSLLQDLIRALFGNLLGDVQGRLVTFTNGQSGPILFNLVHTKLSTAAVGPHGTKWRWQFRTGHSGAWQDFQVSEHRIYALLDLPTAPWQQSPYQQSNTQLPWTDVLEYACRWAIGARTAVDAAAGVTRSVFDLGPGTVTYDCPGGGSSHYSWGGFDCSAFLDRLGGGPGNGIYVNCSDCATFVSTFANAVGCDLWQSQMGYGFGLNPMLGIGSSVWQPCCHGDPFWSDSFSYHEVAWTGACTATEHVYDGCLQVDADTDPTAPPQTPQQPIDMVFGDPGDLTYRDRLAVPASRPSCAPQPGTRQRRAVS